MSDIKNVYDDCIQSTKENPFMNYMALGSKFKKPCDISKEDIDKNFVNAKNSTASKIFYTVPVRQEMSGKNFAQYLYGNTSICRDTGYLCKSNSEQFKENDRLITSYDKHKYLLKKYK
jgi:hypothetical protein